MITVRNLDYVDLYAETNQESDDSGDSGKNYLRGMHVAYDSVHR